MNPCSPALSRSRLKTPGRRDREAGSAVFLTEICIDEFCANLEASGRVTALELHLQAETSCNAAGARAVTREVGRSVICGTRRQPWEEPGPEMHGEVDGQRG